MKMKICLLGSLVSPGLVFLCTPNFLCTKHTEQAVIESRQSRGGGEGIRLHTRVSQYKGLQLQAGRLTSASRDIAENVNTALGYQ